MRDWVSVQKNHIKWIFRSLANLVLKSCTKLLHKNEKSVSLSCTWMFYVENRYILVQGHGKMSLLYKLWSPASCPSHNSVLWNHGIYTNVWKCMTRFPILHILVIFLRLFAFQFALKFLKLPNSNYLKLNIKECNVLWSPL